MALGSTPQRATDGSWLQTQSMGGGGMGGYGGFGGMGYGGGYGGYGGGMGGYGGYGQMGGYGGYGGMGGYGGYGGYGGMGGMGGFGRMGGYGGYGGMGGYGGFGGYGGQQNPYQMMNQYGGRNMNQYMNRQMPGQAAGGLQNAFGNNQNMMLQALLAQNMRSTMPGQMPGLESSSRGGGMNQPAFRTAAPIAAPSPGAPMMGGFNADGSSWSGHQQPQ